MQFSACFLCASFFRCVYFRHSHLNGCFKMHFCLMIIIIYQHWIISRLCTQWIITDKIKKDYSFCHNYICNTNILVIHLKNKTVKENRESETPDPSIEIQIQQILHILAGRSCDVMGTQFSDTRKGWVNRFQISEVGTVHRLQIQEEGMVHKFKILCTITRFFCFQLAQGTSHAPNNFYIDTSDQ